MSPAVRLWELAGDTPSRVFSPFAWRVRLVLNHKQIPYESASWRYADEGLIKPCETVPVLDFEGQRISESGDIVKHLDRHFPNTPQMLNTGQQNGDAYASFFTSWISTVLHKPLLGVIVLDIWNHLAPQDKDYFRRSREERLGATLEQVASKQEENLEQFRAALEPARAVLAACPWLSGLQSGPGWADICLLSEFMWARAVSPVRLLEPSDPLHEWRTRMMKHYDTAIQGTDGYPTD